MTLQNMVLFASMRTAVKPSLQLILDSIHEGEFNMAFDERLFHGQIQANDHSSVLRFYRFSEPTLTVGYGMWRAAQGALGQKLIRRITGGGIVSHTIQDLTYCLIVPLDAHVSLKKVKDSYFFIHSALKNSFKVLGLNADLYQTCDSTCGEKISYCFNSPALHDVMLEGKKVAGAGQKRSLGYLLHQGSIAWAEVISKKPDLSEDEFCRKFSDGLSEAIYG